MKVLVTQNARVFGAESRNVDAGETLELDDEHAWDLINSGNAVKVEEPAKKEEEVPEPILATQGALDHAEALGVDISAIKGTGKDGKVTKADVEAAVSAKEASAKG